MLPILALPRRRPNSSDITSGKCLSNRQTHKLLPAQTLVRHLIPQRGVISPLPHRGQRDHHPRHIPVLEPARDRTTEFLRDDQIVEIIKLLALDGPAHQLAPVQMLPGPQAHGQQIVGRHLVDELLTYIRPVELFLLRLRIHVAIDKLPHRPLQPAMRLVIVWALKHRRQPQGFCVGDGRQIARLRVYHLRLLAFDRADAQARISLQDFVAVEVVEGLRGVLPGDLL